MSSSLVKKNSDRALLVWLLGPLLWHIIRLKVIL
jgi:hypothetical protein